MELIRKNKNLWDPFELFRDLDQALSHPYLRPLSQNFQPEIELRDEKDYYLLQADVPGLNKDDLKIEVSGRRLTLRGERKELREVNEEKGYHYSERVYGAFARTLELPADIQSDKVKATYKNGVLEVKIPKNTKAQPRQIDININ